MKFSILPFLSLFWCMSLNAQVESIKLPAGEETRQVKSLTQFFSVYVDRNNQVYLEKELIPIQNIGALLFDTKSKLPEEYQISVFVYLFIDKNAEYRVVDQIKTQIARAGIVNIFYKTGSIDDKDLLYGIFFKNHESISNFSNFEEEQVAEWEPVKGNDSLSMNPPMAMLDIPPPPPPPPMFWGYELQEQLYRLNQKGIEELLSNKTHECLTISNGSVKTSSKSLDFDSIMDIEKLFEMNKVLFVKFEANLMYENYFKSLRLLKATQKKLGNKTMVLELSSELMQAFKKNKIKLCD